MRNVINASASQKLNRFYLCLLRKFSSCTPIEPLHNFRSDTILKNGSIFRHTWDFKSVNNREAFATLTPLQDANYEIFIQGVHIFSRVPLELINLKWLHTMYDGNSKYFTCVQLQYCQQNNFRNGVSAGYFPIFEIRKSAVGPNCGFDDHIRHRRTFERRCSVSVSNTPNINLVRFSVIIFHAAIREKSRARPFLFSRHNFLPWRSVHRLIVRKAMIRIFMTVRRLFFAYINMYKFESDVIESNPFWLFMRLRKTLECPIWN